MHDGQPVEEKTARWGRWFQNDLNIFYLLQLIVGSGVHKFISYYSVLH